MLALRHPLGVSVVKAEVDGFREHDELILKARTTTDDRP